MNNEFNLAIENIYTSIDNELKRCSTSSNDDYSDINVSDSFKMYLKEMYKYPTLDTSAEQKLVNIFCYPDRVKLLSTKEVDGILYHTLNKELLFTSLINSTMCNSIIDEIINLYSKMDSNDSNFTDDLIKYKKIANFLGRSLNKDELAKYFNINCSVINPIEESQLLNDVINFIRFKYSYNRFFLCNLKLVVFVAKKYRCNVDMLELISEGNLGILKAMNKFDPSLGYKFSTYATHSIKNYVERAIIKYGSTIRLPDSYSYEIRNYKKAVRELEQDEKRELTIDEISEKLNIPVEKINEYYSNMYEIDSLDKKITPDSKYSLMDVIADEDNFEDEVFLRILKDEIGVVFENLTERETEIIKMRFGLDKYDEMKLREIGNELSVSIERARALLARGLFKLHKVSRTDKVKELKYYM